MTARPTHPPPPHPPPGTGSDDEAAAPPPEPAPLSPYALQAGRWHYRRSLASRVIWLTTIAVGMAVAFVAIGAYLTVRMQMQSTLDDDLVQRASNASTRFCDPDFEVPREYLGAANAWLVCVRGPVAVGRSTTDLPSIKLGSEEIAVITGERQQSIRTITGEHSGRWRVVALRRDTGHTMILAQSLANQQSVLNKLGIVMIVFGGLGVLGAGVAGWLVARNGLRPVRRLTTAVEGIARTEDLRPLPVEGDDEIARLATAFNEMLQALEASRQRQRQLVADAGHELRTPMTALRTNIDLLDQATSGDGPVLDHEARAELLHDVRAQIEELTALVGDLTELSRGEPPASVIEDLELSEVVHRAVARVRRRAPSVQFDVVAHPWWVNGDDAALERAVTNLLDNAAKWSPAGSRVSCRLVDGVLTVDDEGPGIPEPDRDKVFDRFWRSREARTLPGSGLGLSIVRQVAERHSGSVEAKSAPGGGARLVMTLPGGPDEPR